MAIQFIEYSLWASIQSSILMIDYSGGPGSTGGGSSPRVSPSRAGAGCGFGFFPSSFGLSFFVLSSGFISVNPLILNNSTFG